jgi:SAM-dependent methyltransferase
MRYDADIVKGHWSTADCSASEKNFYSFPAIRSRSCQLIFDETDATDRAWCEYWTVEKYLKADVPFGNALSICCGFGSAERTLSRLGVAKQIVGTDIAPGAIQEAMRRAESEGLDNIEYYVADLNQDTLPENAYDLIWAGGALHHIADLEGVVPRLYDAMRDGGYLVSNEYVGPKYQQIGPRQRELVNAVKHLLPQELRSAAPCLRPYGDSVFARGTRFARRQLGRTGGAGVYGTLWEGPSVGNFMATDPSEGVSSDRIIPTLQRCFDEVEVKYFNGSILFYALDSAFYDNFDARNPAHEAILQMLFDIEDTLAATGEISQDNAHIVCRKTADSAVRSRVPAEAH